MINQFRFLLSVVASVGIMIALANCQGGSSKPKPGSSNAAGTTTCPTTSTASSTSTSTTDPFASTNTTTNTGTTTNTSLLLANGVTFEKDIRPIVTSSCTASCHKGTGAAGSNEAAANLLTTDVISSLKYFIVDVVAEGYKADKHGSLSLSDTQKQLFRDWETGGYELGSASATSTNTSTTGSVTTSTDSTTASPNCGTGAPGTTSTTTGTTTSTDDYSDLISPAKKKECNDAGNMFNRDQGGSCFEDSKLETAWCNAGEIKKKFQSMANAGAAVESKIKSLQADGWTLDECGIKASKPAVTFYKLDKVKEEITQKLLRPQ